MESGYYIEQVFPLYGVRFIAVSDHYDSADYDGGTGGLDVAFKFLMHEHYSKDLSIKVRSALHILMKNGEHIVGGAIYGYRKNDGGKWEHDPPAAEVVRDIFSMALEGMTTAQIRDKLFAERRPTPKEYERLNKGKDFVPKCMWATQQIWRILTNEQYTGTYIAGKRETSRVGSKTQIKKDKSEWIVFPDSHPPIVNQEDYSRVQEIIRAPKEAFPSNRERSSHSKKLFDKIVSGERKPAAILYGYRMGTNGTLEIDETAAEAVKAVFDLALQDCTAREIAEKLHEAKHLPPGEYFKIAKGKNIQPTYKWPILRIRDILKNAQYTGTYVAGRTFQDESGRKYHTPKSEWIIIPDKYPAIITKEVFEKVQAILSQVRRKIQPHNYLLRGKILCGCCERAMVFSNATTQPMYRCMHTHADPAAACHKMKVVTTEVDEAVMSIIKIQAELVLESGDLSALRKTGEGKEQLAEHKKLIKQLGEQRQTVYEQFVMGDIDRETYRKIKTDFTAQIDKLKNLIAAIKQSELESRKTKNAAEQAKAVLGEILTPREIVETFVEKVHVFPNDHLEITWKFVAFSASK